MLRGDHAQTGVRRFDPYRDLKSVTELIAVAFRDNLGPDGQVALAEMRRIAHRGPLLWWLYWPGWSRGGVAPGFVWVEQGCVVGNVSLRRSLGWGGFFIGNLAVHPDWQGRGIARALMMAALEAISERGGLWVGLEVRADNQIARQLYERLGFRDVGTTLHMLRPAGLSWDGNPPPHPSLRRGRSRDSAALLQLVRATVPESQRPLLELRKKQDYRPGWERALDCWLEGRREVWWVVEEADVVCGAVRSLRERGRRPDRLEVLVEPGRGGHFEAMLVQRGMASLRGASNKMVESILPSTTDPLVSALKAAGFRKLRVLVQMRLDLTRYILAGD
jgi:ribosomal protein S18 acetylase RimI-like enzyme